MNVRGDSRRSRSNGAYGPPATWEELEFHATDDHVIRIEDRVIVSQRWRRPFVRRTNGPRQTTTTLLALLLSPRLPRRHRLEGLLTEGRSVLAQENENKHNNDIWTSSVPNEVTKALQLFSL